LAVSLCPKCDSRLPEGFLRTAKVNTVCPDCFTDIELHVFPAAFRGLETIDRTQLLAAEGEACCYEHAGKRAVDACFRCGRFVCGLCEVKLHNVVWCPACLQLDQTKSRLPDLSRQRILYDSIALGLATWPVLTFWGPLIAAPICIFVTIRYWKKPSSLLRSSKWRFVVAGVLALAELSLIVVLIGAVVVQIQRKGAAP
jgi:hypothetical protein